MRSFLRPDADAESRSTPAGPDVVLVSTFTTDWVPVDGDGRLESVPGGPAHYIGQALTRLRRPYQLYTGERPDVSVVSGPEGEQYVIPEIAPIPLPERLEAPYIILSPIMREIDPEHLPDLNGQVIVDLQGFVRTPSVPSEESSARVNLTALFGRTAVVKATARELEHLDAPSRQALDACTLVLTQGANGSTIRYGGGSHRVVARPCMGARTIGAGDTYLAGLTDALLKGLDIVRAAEVASRFTEQFLTERTI